MPESFTWKFRLLAVYSCHHFSCRRLRRAIFIITTLLFVFVVTLQGDMSLHIICLLYEEIPHTHALLKRRKIMLFTYVCLLIFIFIIIIAAVDDI